MLVTLGGIVTLVRLEQDSNALLPILVTLVGIEMSPDIPQGHWMSVLCVLSNKIPFKLL